MRNMEAVFRMALTKAIPSKVAKATRKELQSGAYRIKGRADVSCELRIGEDYEQTPTHKVPKNAVIALLLQKMNFNTQAAAMQFLQGIMETAIQGEEKVSDVLTDDKAIEELATSIANTFSETLTKQTMAGKVTTRDMDVRISDLALVSG